MVGTDFVPPRFPNRPGVGDGEGSVPRSGVEVSNPRTPVQKTRGTRVQGHSDSRLGRFNRPGPVPGSSRPRVLRGLPPESPPRTPRPRPRGLRVHVGARHPGNGSEDQERSRRTAKDGLTTSDSRESVPYWVPDPGRRGNKGLRRPRRGEMGRLPRASF